MANLKGDILCQIDPIRDMNESQPVYMMKLHICNIFGLIRLNNIFYK